jgi:hypothetical protein
MTAPRTLIRCQAADKEVGDEYVWFFIMFLSILIAWEILDL